MVSNRHSVRFQSTRIATAAKATYTRRTYYWRSHSGVCLLFPNTPALYKARRRQWRRNTKRQRTATMSEQKSISISALRSGCIGGKEKEGRRRGEEMRGRRNRWRKMTKSRKRTAGCRGWIRKSWRRGDGWSGEEVAANVSGGGRGEMRCWDSEESLPETEEGGEREGRTLGNRGRWL